MDIELTPEIINAVIFCMENQTKTFLFDTETFRCVPASFPPDERFIQIPEWSAVHGFRLMEEFTGSVKNPLLREKLRETISTRAGVFKRFRNVLSEYPEFEREWRAFKKERLTRTVLDWFGTFTQAEMLSAIGEEPEETAEIVQSDFVFSRKKPKGDFSRAFREIAEGFSAEKVRASSGIERDSPEEILIEGTAEFFSSLPENTRRASGIILSRLFLSEGEEELFFAETASGEKAAALLTESFFEKKSGKSVRALKAATVKPKFRGMGLFTQLAEKAASSDSLSDSNKENKIAFLCAMPVPNPFLLNVLERLGADIRHAKLMP